MVWGLWRPTILLPDDAAGWPRDRLQVVLLHELAHIRRHDCLTQLLGQLARALYWFNPLAWLALRRLRIEQEQACDDSVLTQGYPGPDYAEHLLAVSVGYRSGARPAIALAIATPSKIERRLRCILDSSRNRQPLSARRLGIAATIALAVSATLSVAHLDDVEAGVEAQTQSKTPEQAVRRADDAAIDASRLATLRSKIAEQYATRVDDKDIVQGAIKGMVGALRDPYSDYLTAEMVADMERQVGGTMVGIGAQLELHEKAIRVVTPLPNSPALKAGLQPGDVILQIDDKPATGLGLPEAIKLIAGPQDTVVHLKIGRAAGQQIDLQVTRGRVVVPTVRGIRRGPDQQWMYLLDAGRKIGYVQVAQFGAATPQELRAVLQPLNSQGLRGLIFDLRFCPGGTLDSALSVARMFLAQGTIVSLHSRDSEVTYRADGSQVVGNFPMIVLVNDQTASAAEIVAGALQDHRRAVVLGTRTFGKGSVQSIIKLDDASDALKLTTSSYRLPNGRNIDRREGTTAWGVDPDDGFFMPLDRAQTKALLQQRQERDIITSISGQAATQTAATPQSIEEQHADPQLAAALNTLIARLTTGEFVKVGRSGSAEIERFLKREDVERRREAVLQNLQQLDRELADLEQEAPAKTKPE
jgi:carboxyl-terminal processing protease